MSPSAAITANPTAMLSTLGSRIGTVRTGVVRLRNSCSTVLFSNRIPGMHADSLSRRRSGNASGEGETAVSMASPASDFRWRTTATCRAAASGSESSDADLTESLLSGRKLTVVAHQLWRGVVRAGDTVVDATCGNGHDALAMAKLALMPAPGSHGDAGSTREEVRGRLVAMDLQEEAVRRTNQLLTAGLTEEQMSQVQLVCACHSTLLHHVAPDSARLVAFNLGYLPRPLHSSPTASLSSPSPPAVITAVTSTVAALRAAVEATAVGGVVSVMAYVGHPGGREEYEAVAEVASSLPADSWVCWEHRSINRPLSPRLVLMRRKR